jgi:hypothetical protein
MSTVTTSPNPVIQDSSATLLYTSPNLILLPSLEYVLKNTLGNNVSSTYTAPVLTPNYIAPNINNSYTSTNSACFHAPNGDIYTTMEFSSIAGNGLIQLTSNGVSSNYLQFDNSGNPPVPSNFYSPQYPTGITMDSSGNLYFLVFGDNNLYKINNINEPTDPSNNLSVYNKNPAVISAPFELTITPNNYFYITDTQSPYNIQQIDTSDISGNTTAIPNYTANRSAYGITSDFSNNLYIGYAGGVIGKYDLTPPGTFTDNFINLPSADGSILSLVYISSKNVLVANTTSTNIYVINLLNNNYLKIIDNSGILGGIGTNIINSIYGTTANGMVKYIFDSVLIFNNLYLTNTGINVLTVNDVSTSTVLDTINVNVTTSNATGYYYGGLQTGTDLINIFQPISLGDPYLTTTGYKADISGNIQDFNQIFASLSTPGSIDVSYNVGWKVGSQDLSQIFAAYNPIIYDISNQNAYLTSTVLSNNGYTGIIFENSTIPSSSQFYATCNITFLVNKTITFLVIGGGGGGGAGNSSVNCGGGGAGGSSFVYQTTTPVTANTQFSLQVGFGGLGRQANNPGGGNSTGNTGGNSFIITTGTNFTANGGAGGKGVGTAQGYAGGVGGSSVNSLNNTSGGGGGSGGGASADPTGAACNSGPPGNLNTSYNVGGQGGTGNTTTGGTGGNCYNSTSVSLPFTSTASTVYFGNGGGGGADSTGGSAGFTTGGAGSGSTIGTRGQNAIYGLNSGNYYYGNGGGGGAQSTSNWGGSGGNGVVMIWWQN